MKDDEGRRRDTRTEICSPDKTPDPLGPRAAFEMSSPVKSKFPPEQSFLPSPLYWGETWRILRTPFERDEQTSLAVEGQPNVRTIEARVRRRQAIDNNFRILPWQQRAVICEGKAIRGAIRRRRERAFIEANSCPASPPRRNALPNRPCGSHPDEAQCSPRPCSADPRGSIYKRRHSAAPPNAVPARGLPTPRSHGTHSAGLSHRAPPCD
jgi:hypothetical protein